MTPEQETMLKPLSVDHADAIARAATLLVAGAPEHVMGEAMAVVARTLQDLLNAMVHVLKAVQ